MNKTEKQTVTKKIEKIRKSGNIQKAIELCQYEIAQDPGNPNTARLHIELGDLYIEWHLDIHQEKQYIDEAITQYQQALELNVESAELYYKLGVAFFFNNDFNKAIDYLKRAIEKNDKYHQAYYLLAQCHTGRNEIFRALEYLKKAIECNRFFSSAYSLTFKLTNLREKQGIIKFCKCVYYLTCAILSFPFDKMAIKTVKNLISELKFIPAIIKANYYIIKNKPLKAVEIYQQAIIEAPSFSDLYEILGKLYHTLNRDDEAICEYKMAIWLNSLNINAYKSLCYIYETQENYEAAIDMCNRMIQLQPHVSAHYSELASLQYLKEDVNSAISNYQNALTLSRNSNDVSRDAQFLGYVLHKGGQNYDAAIASYQLARQAQPGDIEIYINLGNAFYDKGEYENAQIVYKKALEIDPCNAKIHCNLGYLYWGCGIMDEAIKSYELALKYDTEYALAYNNLGVIYLDDLGRVTKAAELFEAAIKYNPNYALAYYNLGRTKEIVAGTVEAAKLYQIAYDLNKFSNEIDPGIILDKIQTLFS